MRAWRLLGCALTLASGCGLSSDGADRDRDPGPGEICATPQIVDLGEVALGESAAVDITLAPCDARSVVVADLSITPDSLELQPQALRPAQEFPFELSAETPVVATLRYTPGDEGADRFKLRVTPEQGEVLEIPVAAVGVTPARCELVATPASLSFGDVQLGDEAAATLRLTQVVAGHCNVAAVALDGDSDFVLNAQPPLPQRLEHQGALDFELRFAPRAEGEGSAVLSVTDPAGDALLEILVLGAGVPPPRCALSIEPEGGRLSDAALDFGPVLVGDAHNASVNLSNDGDLDCQLLGAELRCGFFGGGPCPFSIVAPTLPVRVEPGQAQRVTLAYAPTAAAQHRFGYQLRVETDDPEHQSQAPGRQPPGRFVVDLRGQGVASPIAVEPVALDFGAVAAGCQAASRCVDIVNQGLSPVSLSELEISEPAFSVLQAPSLPAELAPQQRVQVCVGVELPEDAPLGEREGTLVLRGNGLEGGEASVPLSAEVVASGPQQEVVDVPAFRPVDLLVVVDNGTGGAGLQGRLAGSIERLLDEALRRQVDYQAAVIASASDAEVTADSLACRGGESIVPGRLFGEPRVVTAGPNAPELLACNLQLGECCADPATPLAALALALEPPIADDPTATAALLREDARFAVLVVSERDDGSPEALEAYAEVLAAFGATVAVIAGPKPDGCDPVPPATRLAGLSELLPRVVFESVCEPDLGPALNRIGATLFGGERRIALGARPAEISLSDPPGLLQDSPQGWRYDAANGELIIGAEADLSPGQPLTVDYALTCP